MLIKINNSNEAADHTKGWENPGASLYDTILQSKSNWEFLLKEAYLIAPTKKINNNRIKTPYLHSGCKYPHHIIKDGTLILSEKGIMAAYARAKQQHIYKGDVKAHIDKHYEELHLSSNNYKESTELPIADLPIKSLNEKSSKDIIKDNFKQIHLLLESVKEKTEKLYPIYILARYVDFKKHDGDPKSKISLHGLQWARTINKITNGDLYGHAGISFDDELEPIYSFNTDTNGLSTEHLHTLDWEADKIYAAVCFVEKENLDRTKNFIEKLKTKKTSYGYLNFIFDYLGLMVSSDTRLTCSSFVGVIMHLADPKVTPSDYTRTRPQDVTVFPRTFYIMHLDPFNWKRQKEEFKNKVKKIYNQFHDKLIEHNNMIPKILLTRKTKDHKIFDNINDWMRKIKEGNKR